MTKAERRELLRQRVKAKGGLLPLMPSCGKRVSAAEPKPKGYVLQNFGNASGVSQPDWLKTPDAPQPIVLRAKCPHGPCALTKIAAQLPAKLPRVLLPR